MNTILIDEFITGLRSISEAEFNVGTVYDFVKEHPVDKDVKDLPPPLNDGEAFLHEGLKHKVMTVPGVFFDVNPGKRRRITSNFKSWVRFSFGPPENNVIEGLNRLERMINTNRQTA